MPKKFDRFFLELAEKAGILPTDARLAPLLAHTQLKDIDVPDEVVSAISTNLLSIDDAKANHPAIKTHYFTEIMANVDRQLADIYRDFNFSTEEIAEFNAERSSTKRLGLVAKKFADKVEAAKNDPAKKGSANEEALKADITRLNGELATIKQTMTQKETEYQNTVKNMKRDTLLAPKFTSVGQTIYDSLPAEMKTMSIRTIIEKELQDNNAHVVLGDDGQTLLLQKKDGNNYFDENNRQIGVDDFINKTLAKHKILVQTAASDGSTAGTQSGGNSGEHQQGQRVITPGSQQQGGQNGQQTTTKRDLSSVFNSRKAAMNNKNPLDVVNGS